MRSSHFTAALFVFLLGFTTAIGASHLESLASARALAAEQSWEQAKLHFAEALATAPDAEARAWCELWLTDATWRSELTTRWRWDADWRSRHLARYDELEKPYVAGRPRDDLWIALLTSRADLENAIHLTEAAGKHRTAVADHLAAQPPSAEAAQRYVSFLQQTIDASDNASSRDFEPIRPHLAHGARIGATADDRAWCVWQLARIRQIPTHTQADARALPAERADRWSAALAAATGTRWLPFVRAEEFLWRVSARYSPELPANAPADIPAFLAELQTLRQALRDDAHPDATELRTELDNLEQNLSRPHLIVECGVAFRPDSRVRFSYGAAGLTRLHAVLERVEPAPWLAIRNDNFTNPQPASRLPRPDGTELIRDWSLALSDPAQRAWNTQIVDAATALPPGLYLLTLRGETRDDRDALGWQGKFAVSDLRGIAVLSSATEGRLFVYRSADGSPVAGAAVNGLAVGKRTPTTWQGATDALGGTAVSALDSQSLGMLAFVAGEPIWFRYHGLYGGAPETLVVDVYTDRPLFRPGETAHWKLIARERRGNRFTIPTDLEGLKLRVMLGDTTLVEPAPLQLNAHGTAHGEIEIPRDVRPGEATLQLFRGTANDPDPTVDSDAPLFRVDRFVPPAVVATMDFPDGARSLQPGREITVRVNARYFSGGPLVGASVYCKFYVSEPSLEAQSKEFTEWIRTLAEQPHEATTDASGEARFTLSLPTFLPEHTDLTASAIVAAAGATPAHADAAFTVSTIGLTLDPQGWTHARLARPGDRVTFTARVRDSLDQPTSFSGRAQLLELRWTEVWLDDTGRTIPSDELFAHWRKTGSATLAVPDDWRLVHAGYAETIVSDVAAESDADGRITVTAPLPHAGLFRLRLFDDVEIAPQVRYRYDNEHLFDSRRRERAADREADRRREVLSIVAIDETTASLALNPETAAIVVPSEIDPAQPPTLLGMAPAGANRAWFSLRGERQTVTVPAELRDRLALHTFEHPPSFLGSGSAEFLYDSPAPTQRGSVTARISASNAEGALKLAFLPAREEQRPGESANVLVIASDHAGQPVANAELAVSASDEAVHSLLGAETTDRPPSFFHTTSTVHAQQLWSASDPLTVSPILDPRPGAIRNPSPVINEDGELIHLSAFEVQSQAFGYTAMASLGGARRNTQLKDFGGAITRMDATPQSKMASSPIELRRHFSSTAFWTPAILTDANGEARVTFAYPDNLTQWRIGAYAVGADGNTFGTGHAFTRTSLPFQARLNLPRFLIAGDSAEPSATVVNRTDADLHATASLGLAGPVTAHDPSTLTRTALAISPQSESRTAWSIRANAVGDAQLTLTAHAGNEGDAMQLPLPILEDGIPQHTAAFGRLAENAATASFSLDLPSPLDPARTEVSVQLSPHHAIALLDALPYLIDYPYGCVEQTMNRFLPAIVVRHTLTDLGLDASAVERRILTRETSADRSRRERSAGLDHLDDVVRQSLARLDEAHSHFGFGWWLGAPSPDLWMTAYVSWGLSLAASADADIPDRLHEISTRSLVNALAATDSTDDRTAFALAALARAPDLDDFLQPADAAQRFSQTYAARERLAAAGRAWLALAAKKFGTREQLATLRRNLDNGLQRASAAGLGETVHWGATQTFWRAHENAVEATALTLLALLELDPASELIEPAVNWLTLNRRSNRWSSTRDTAFAVLALSRFLQQRQSLDASGEFELVVNGTALRRVTFTRASLLDTPSTYAVPAARLRAGENRFELRRVAGTNPVHATALAVSWARGDSVRPAGHLLEVARLFERQQAAPTLVGALRITPVPLGPAGAARTNEEVTARVTLTVSNELEYVMIEVPKPAGCEPLNPLSGWDAQLVRLDAGKRLANVTLPAGQGRSVYREEHDDRSVFFLDRLEPGTWELRFGLRAVTPGDFRALPVTATAMYVPEIAANTDARLLVVEPAP